MDSDGVKPLLPLRLLRPMQSGSRFRPQQNAATTYTGFAHKPQVLQWSVWTGSLKGAGVPMARLDRFIKGQVCHSPFGQVKRLLLLLSLCPVGFLLTRA